MRHPLAALNEQEIAQAIAITTKQGLKGDVHRRRFISVEIVEPSKQQLYEYNAKPFAMDRIVKVVIVCHKTPCSFEAIMSLTSGKLQSWKQMASDVQPMLKAEEFIAAEQAVRNDPKAQEVLLKRGVPNLDWVMIEPWGAGYYGDKNEKGKRLMKTLVFTRLDPLDNGYAHPVEGLSFIVDLNTLKVEIEETQTDVPIPTTRRNYSPRYYDKEGVVLRKDIKRIEIEQPEGPTWTVKDENLVSWAGWNFRVGFNAKEGLTLHDIQFRNHNVLFRASVAEMVVPYGCPEPIASRKNAFDAGHLANSLKLGCDCLGFIHYFDGILHDSFGKTLVIKNAICMHEEDWSVLWKHYDWRLQESEIRRNRRLIISFWATVGNYEYGFYWSFYLDGSIQLEVKHSGIINTNAIKEGKTDKYSSHLGNGLIANVHQHLYCARLDWAVDGVQNSFAEINVQPEEDPKKDPKAQAFYATETVFKKEQDAARDIDIEKSRFWKVFNSTKKNGIGEHPGYLIMPAYNVKAFAQKNSWIIKRAPWLKHHIWVTQYDKDELFPSGEHPNQSDGVCGGTTLEAWVQKNRSIVNTDLVTWHSFGITHVVRPEDFPIMNVVPLLGFTLAPHGMFERNPTLDIPKEPKHDKSCSVQSKL